MDGAKAREAGEFCVRVRPQLVGTLSLYCGDADVAEELTQDTLARVWDRWAQVREMPSPHAWAYRVGVNLANSHYRRRAAERRATSRRERLAGERGAADLADAIVVRQAVAALPRRQKTALVLRYYADLPIDEVASLMSCAPGTVKALTHQAIARLRDTIGTAEFSEVHHGS